MTAILKKELKSSFSTFYGYLLIGIYLFFSGLFVSYVCLLGGASSIELTYSHLSFVFLLTVPLFSLKGISYERKQKTDILLYSLPIGSFDIVIGKFLSMVIITGGCQIVGFMSVIILSFYGKINLLSAIIGTVALFLFSSALNAIGLFISSVCKNNLVSPIVSLAAMLLIYFSSDLAALLPTTVAGSFVIITVLALAFSLFVGYITNNFAAGAISFALPELINIAVLIFFPKTEATAAAKLFSALSPTQHLNTFTTYEILDIQGIVYFVLLTALFVYFSYLAVEKRRWS